MQAADFEEIELRNGTKGVVKSKVAIVNVYT
jgi:hypothetical protein